MEYNFLNDVFKDAVGYAGSNAFSSENSSSVNNFILDTNKSVLDEMISFFQGNDKAFVIRGFMGSGKSVIVDSLSEFLSADTLLFKVNYYISSNLDDILLSLYRDFTFFHRDKRIILPKVESNVFADKINAFIKSIDKPMVFVFDSLELSKASKNVERDIISFIEYLTKFDKVKVVVASRSFDETDLPNLDSVNVAMAKLLDIDRFSQLIAMLGIEENAFQVEQLFKLTKGHHLYASMVVNLVGLLKISFPNLAAEFSKRNSEFSEFLVFKILGLLPDKFLKILWFLGAIRHGVSESFIIKQNLCSKDDIEHLKSRMVLAGNADTIYLKDYIKTELMKTIESDSLAKVHNYLKDLYESQLPKKPFERDLLISRVTMRNEIEYHITQAKEARSGKSSQSQPGESVGFNYLSYSRSVTYDWNFQSTPIAFTNVPEIQSKKVSPSAKNSYELSEEEYNLLNSSSESANEPLSAYLSDVTSKSNQKNKSVDAADVDLSELELLIKKAQDFENSFDFKSAVDSYKKALLLNKDLMFDIKKPLIMTKLAICYKKMQDYQRAVEQFENVYNLYLKTEPVKANYIMLNIAQIYNETYKFSQAKEIYEKILNSQTENPAGLQVRALLDLSEIEDNNSNVKKAVDCCFKALVLADNIDDLSLKGELYFKYALLLDDIGKVDEAFMYYKMCIEVSDNPEINTYLSSAYSNLAGIYSEKNKYLIAVDYYKKAIDVDKAQNNFEGLYFGYSKLAHILQSESPDLALENLVKALGAARRLEDSFYSASVYLDLGDFYYNRKFDVKALKSYLQAKSLILKQPNEDNLQKVNMRINDLKIRLGHDKFTQLLNELKKK